MFILCACFIQKCLILFIFRWRRAHNVTSPIFNPLHLNTDAVDDLLDRIKAKHEESETSAGLRIEELEKQVTEMTLDLLRATKRSHAYEEGLNSLRRCQTVDENRDQVHKMQIIAGKHLSSSYNTNALR